MEKNICIVHFNTPKLTRATIRSVRKHTHDCRITVFDNSDSVPFGEMDGVTVIDNTKGQVIDFNKIISEYPNRVKSNNNYGSAKHCCSVDYLMDLFEDGFVLLDSDVLVIKDLSPLFNADVAWVGQVDSKMRGGIIIKRLYPFCCFINTGMCRQNSIRYFNGNYMWKLTKTGRWYDTGAWFLRATRKLPCMKICLSDYIIHYGGASFNRKESDSQEEWLNKYKKYYE